jgi:hypothetical protein
MSCEEKVRQIVFRLEHRLETVRGAVDHYSERLGRAAIEKHLEYLAKHIREVSSIFEADEKEMIALLGVARASESWVFSIGNFRAA